MDLIFERLVVGFGGGIVLICCFERSPDIVEV